MCPPCNRNAFIDDSLVNGYMHAVTAKADLQDHLRMAGWCYWR